jgi:hypothetical protein
MMPSRKWTSQKEVVELAEDILKAAQSGKIQGLAYVAECADESYQSGATRVDNQFAIAGYMVSMGLRVMGFHDHGGDKSPLQSS